MKTFGHRIQAAVSREAVWRILADVSGWSGWITDLQWARLDGPFETGVHGAFKPAHAHEQAFTLEGVIPGELMALVVRHALLHVEVLFTLAAQGAGLTTVESRITISGPIAWMVASQVKKRVADRISELLHHLAERARALDSRDGTGPGPAAV